jgi:hypothetical protein
MRGAVAIHFAGSPCGGRTKDCTRSQEPCQDERARKGASGRAAGGSDLAQALQIDDPDMFALRVDQAALLKS